MCSAASSDCKVAGICKAGKCPAETSAADHTTCNDQDSSTTGDKCTSGVCRGTASGVNQGGTPNKLDMTRNLFTSEAIGEPNIH